MTLRIFIVFVSLLLFVGVLIFLEPEWIVALLRKRSPSVLYSIETHESVISLTIDDGPDPIQTSKILDILGKYNAHATFFLISSRIPGNEEIVQRMLEEGHEIANHMVYDERSIRLDKEEFEKQLLETDQVLAQFGEATWFRPGSGWYNNGMLAVIQEHGYRCALGSVYPFDPQIGISWFIENYVLWKVRAGGIIVLHDFGARGGRTAIALATILPELQERGYNVVTLSELVEAGDREE